MKTITEYLVSSQELATILKHHETVSFQEFKDAVRKLVPSEDKLPTSVLEIAFVMLCRRVPYDQLSKLEPDELKSALLGFKPYNLSLIFEEPLDSFRSDTMSQETKSEPFGSQPRLDKRPVISDI